MPKISAPTIREHRALRFRTLLAAARDLVATEGPEALTLGALSQHVEISRPAIYEYFRSRDDLLAAIVEEEMPSWEAQLMRSLESAGPSPSERVAAYVAAQLRMLRDGRHAAAVLLSAHALDSEARVRIRAEHERLLDPLVNTLTEAGLDQPRLRALLIQGIVNSAARLLATGDGTSAAGIGPIGDGERIISAAVAQAVTGLGQDLPARARRIPSPAGRSPAARDSRPGIRGRGAGRKPAGRA